MADQFLHVQFMDVFFQGLQGLSDAPELPRRDEGLKNRPLLVDNRIASRCGRFPERQSRPIWLQRGHGTIHPLNRELSIVSPEFPNYEARAMIALLAWYDDHLSLRDVATQPGRDLSSPSQAVNRLRRRLETNRRPAGRVGLP